MDKDFEENMGKEVPYRVPDHFFEESQREIWARIQREDALRKRRRWRIAFSTLAVAAVLSGLLFLPLTLRDKGETRSGSELAVDVNSALDSWIQNMSDEELERLVAFSENDIFLH